MSRGALVAAATALAVLTLAVVAAWRAVDAGLGHLPDGAWANEAADVLLRLRATDLEAPSTLDAEPVAFEIADGEPVQSVAERLQAEGLVRDAGAFALLARARGLDRGIQAGSHTLDAHMDADTILTELQSAVAPGIRITIPEGRRAEEVAEILEATGVASAEDFVAVVRDPSMARDEGFGVVAQRPADAGLEGYLFPDTYQVDPTAGVEAVAELMAETFARRYDAADTEGEGSGMSAHETTIVASIVEREAQLAEERPRIAAVFLNRLTEPPYLLGADPTVQYALGLQPDPKSWWKRPLTLDDLEVASPYNTYRVPGLPPGPIASPGLASLAAVLAPEQGTWRYFVANEVLCDGSHVFAETFEEHQANVGRYRTGGCLP